MRGRMRTRGGWKIDKGRGRIDRVAASVGRSKTEGGWPERGGGLLFMPLGGIEGANRSRSAASSIERRRRATLFESRGGGENESNERESERASGHDTIESAKSGEGRQRIAESHGWTRGAAGWERRKRWRRRRRTGGSVEEERSRRRYYRRLSEIDARNEGAKRTTGGQGTTGG